MTIKPDPKHTERRVTSQWKSRVTSQGKSTQLKANRQGEGLETIYSVIPSPPKETPAEIPQDFKSTSISLKRCSMVAIPSGRRRTLRP